MTLTRHPVRMLVTLFGSVAADNRISDDTYGVFLGQVAPATVQAFGLGSNRFINVTNDVVTCQADGSLCFPA